MPRRELRDDWQSWLAENMLSGVAEEEIAARLVERGIPTDEARTMVAAARAHPFLRAAMPLAQALRRRDALLGVQATLAGLVMPDVIPRRAALTVEQFLTEHYAVQRPVILTGALDQMRALARWSWAYLAGAYGALEVEIQDGRASAPGYQRDFAPLCRRVMLAELIARIRDEPSSNDYYLTARNQLLSQPGARPLLDDLQPLPELLVSPPRANDTSVWIGPAGTLTPLHHDWVNAVIAQVRGRKRFHLVPAWEAPRVANHESRFADVDAEHPELAGPRFAEARRFDVVLEPGELLFVPVGWWHQVRALEPSISVTFTGFVLPNAYAWDTDTSR